MKTGWRIIETATDTHVVPDGEDHKLSLDCICQPRLSLDGVVIHFAFDNREKYETGELKPH